MTWWEGLLLGIGIITAAVVWRIYRPLSPEELADGQELANMIRYELDKHPEIRRELLDR